MHNNLLTQNYGPMHGLRVMLSGSALAGPWTARMFGDYGAEVIKIEPPGTGDASRIGQRHESGIVPKWDSLDRNMLDIELNMNFEKAPEAREVFVDLCRHCDIWVNNVPNIGKHGATDALALEANPKLIICHTTGFGLPESGGDPNYLGRSCVDPVGQAFSGLASVNGMPDGPYITANPIMNDVIAGTLGFCGIMVAYYNMLQTGKGQVVDNSMYETAAYIMNYTWAISLNGGGPYVRTGALSPTYYPFGYYKCGNGEWVSVGCFGPAMWKRFSGLLGFDADEYTYADVGVVGSTVPEKKAVIEEMWQKYLSEHSAEEVERDFCNVRIPSCRILTVETAFTHPHWIARNNWIKLKDHTNGTEVHDFATAPHFLGTPIDYDKYEAAPILGEHTDAILGKILGYSEEKISALKDSGAVAASMITK